MNLQKFTILAMALAFVSSAPAHAVAKIAAVGNFNFSKLATTTGGVDSTSDSKLGIGAGALLELSTGLMTAFEVGLLYHPRKAEAAGITTTSNYLLVPAQFRLWFSPFIVIGAGGYFAKGIGDTSRSGSVGGITIDATGSTPEDDFGLIGSAGFDLPLAPLTSIVLEARYLLGLKDFDDSSDSAKLRDLQGLVGIRFGI